MSRDFPFSESEIQAIRQLLANQPSRTADHRTVDNWGTGILYSSLKRGSAGGFTKAEVDIYYQMIFDDENNPSGWDTSIKIRKTIYDDGFIGATQATLPAGTAIRWAMRNGRIFFAGYDCDDGSDSGD